VISEALNSNLTDEISIPMIRLVATTRRDWLILAVVVPLSAGDSNVRSRWPE
jgi:hypothetical protein